MTAVLALYSSTPQHGKTTVAKTIQASTGATVLSFAHAPRLMLASLMRTFGHNDESIHWHLRGDGKHMPIEGIGKSYRECMESLASGWGRRLLGEPDIWARQVERQIEKERERGTLLIMIDDLRMPHEYEAMARQGAFMARISKPDIDLTAANNVESNRGLDDEDAYPMHMKILNNGSREQLARSAYSLIDMIEADASPDHPGQSRKSVHYGALRDPAPGL